ncbi:hypothetical protein QTP86_011452 [Hemibagrus guttatus]|nr:hypothetical protein QTP86_011452 [Hemibagrus guttatus]
MSQPTTTRTFSKWSPEAEEMLKDCFECTDWSVLQEIHNGNIEDITHCLTVYLNFCMDIIVPARTVPSFPNDKPWITSEVKLLLNLKKKAFKDNDKAELKRIQKELKSSLKEAKETYKRKVEK